MNDPLETRLWGRVDADGSLRSHAGLARLVGGNRVARMTLGALGIDKSQLSALVELADKADQHVAAMARVIGEFSAWGWAPSGMVPMNPYLQALRALDNGESRDEVEELILDGWRESTLNSLSLRLRGLGVDDAQYQKLFAARAELMELAWGDHRAKRFHASVPVVAAQVEGLCLDVAGKAFFSRRDGVEPIDDTSLAGVREGLPVAREWFSANVSATVLDPEPSRHGVLHGRSLGYQTELISTKYFVLFEAVLEWASPLAQREGERRKTERQASHAGSQDVDAAGRRLDDREFEETRAALDDVLIAQLCSAKEGFRETLADVVQLSGSRAVLDAAPGIVLLVDDDRAHWYAWRRTISGWVLGVGGSSELHDWHWDAPEPPSTPPPGPGWVADIDDLPNWSDG